MELRHLNLYFTRKLCKSSTIIRRKTEVSWYGKPNKPGDTYIEYGEKYMWGEIKKIKEKSDDLIKATRKFKKEGESVRNIIKSYNFSE